VVKVIEALRKGENALLESPTGTGKTISFLCAAVAYVKNEREKAQQQLKKQMSRAAKENTHSKIDSASF
jgi:Rad3-related DNA helicase